MPIFGNIFKYIYIVRICRSLDTLLKGGVPISRGLEVVRDVVGNKVYFDVLSETIKEVSEGNSIAEGFSMSEDIPVMVYQMIGVGEEIGKLEEILEKITDFYSREINNKVKNLSSMIEPLIMVVLGLAVGLFVAAIILPMWQLSSSM
jgi:type IV pilus assembly protein PilC